MRSGGKGQGFLPAFEFTREGKGIGGAGRRKNTDFRRPCEHGNGKGKEAGRAFSGGLPIEAKALQIWHMREKCGKIVAGSGANVGIQRAWADAALINIPYADFMGKHSFKALCVAKFRQWFID